MAIFQFAFCPFRSLLLIGVVAVEATFGWNARPTCCRGLPSSWDEAGMRVKADGY